MITSQHSPRPVSFRRRHKSRRPWWIAGAASLLALALVPTTVSAFQDQAFVRSDAIGVKIPETIVEYERVEDIGGRMAMGFGEQSLFLAMGGRNLISIDPVSLKETKRILVGEGCVGPINTNRYGVYRTPAPTWGDSDWVAYGQPTGTSTHWYDTPFWAHYDAKDADMREQAPEPAPGVGCAASHNSHDARMSGQWSIDGGLSSLVRWGGTSYRGVVPGKVRAPAREGWFMEDVELVPGGMTLGSASGGNSALLKPLDLGVASSWTTWKSSLYVLSRAEEELFVTAYDVTNWDAGAELYKLPPRLWMKKLEFPEGERPMDDEVWRLHQDLRQGTIYVAGNGRGIRDNYFYAEGRVFEVPLDAGAPAVALPAPEFPIQSSTLDETNGELILATTTVETDAPLRVGTVGAKLVTYDIERGSPDLNTVIQTNAVERVSSPRQMEVNELTGDVLIGAQYCEEKPVLQCNKTVPAILKIKRL